ncbi:MAG: amidohydrolase family protein [Firmicutes bacterium]|nr:amidohydrolase family protein [Bacillota bacterium]
MKNNYKIIDAHCHIYPDKIAAAASNSISDFYDGAPVRYNGSLSQLFNAGVGAGADGFVVHSVAVSPQKSSPINRFIAQTVQEGKGLFTGLGALHPDSNTLESDIQEIIDLGLHGVKLHADIQQIAINDPRCFKIYEIIQGRLPVLLHTGDFRYAYSNPENVLPVLKAFKNLTVVGAHFGGWSVWEEAAQKLSSFENFYVDTSSTFGFADKGLVEMLLNKYSANRILFGTDYPMWSLAQELDYLFSLNLSAEKLEKILYLNAVRVYGIKQAGAA